MVKLVGVSDDAIAQAAQILRDGGLVGMPTETVYGLAANANDGRAVAKIFAAKGRPSFNPLIIHVASLEDAEKIAIVDDRARAVARQIWPGPLTLVLPRRPDCTVSELCSAGLPTLAVRVPAHPAALALLKAAGVPVAAPSANKSGEVSPTTPAHVAQSFGNEIDLILAAGACKVGLESTVADVSGDVPAILRPGAVTAADIEAILGVKVIYDAGDEKAPRSPGQLLRHYAPKTKVRLNAVDLEPGEALLAFGSVKFMGIRGGGAAKDLPDHSLRNLSEDGDLNEAAANLFRMLRELDDPAHKAIAVMNIPARDLGIAINDRLKKAEAGTR